MIAMAKRANPDIAFREGDAEALPFDPGSFDAVVMNFGLLHLARPDQSHRRSAASARAGRTLRLHDLGIARRSRGFRYGAESGGNVRPDSVGLPEGPPFFRFSDAEECRRVMAAGGLRRHPVRSLAADVGDAFAGRRVFEAVTRGGVRTSAVLRAQTPAALERIRLGCTGDPSSATPRATCSNFPCRLCWRLEWSSLPRRSSQRQASGGG